MFDLNEIKAIARGVLDGELNKVDQVTPRGWEAIEICVNSGFTEITATDIADAFMCATNGSVPTTMPSSTGSLVILNVLMVLGFLGESELEP